MFIFLSSQCPVCFCRTELTCLLFWPSPPVSRVWRVLQPLPERGSWHAVHHLQRLHIPVRHLPRGSSGIVQFLPDLRARGTYQPHDGVVSDPGGVSHRVWVSLPARKHFLNFQTEGIVGNPRGAHKCRVTSSLPGERPQNPFLTTLGYVPLASCVSLGPLFSVVVGGMDVAGGG